MLVSIITPFLDEEQTLAILLERVAATALPTGMTREFVLVDDGSHDGSNALAAQEQIGLAGTIKLSSAKEGTGINGASAVTDTNDAPAADDLALPAWLRPKLAPLLVTQVGPSGPSATKGIRSFISRVASDTNRSGGIQSMNSARKKKEKPGCRKLLPTKKKLPLKSA